MTYNELREAVARAIYDAWRDHFDIREDTPPFDEAAKDERTLNLREANAALRVVREALREPPTRIKTATGYGIPTTTAIDHWRAMLAASPLGGGDE